MLYQTRDHSSSAVNRVLHDQARINWLIVTFSDLDHHVTVPVWPASATLAPTSNTQDPALFKLIFVINDLTMSYFEQ